MKRDEYIRASRIALRRILRKDLLWSSYFSILFIIFSIYLVMEAGWWIWVLGPVFAGFIVIYGFFLYFGYSQFQFKKLAKIGGTISTIVATADYIEITHPILNSKMHWHDFLELWTNSEFYFLLAKKQRGKRQMAYFMPKHAFKKPEEMLIFEGFMRDGIEKVIDLKDLRG
jgi:hypothetical protein